MDTSTHITFGFGLAGLAYLDPAVSSDPALATAILFGTVLGSNAPDFDYLIKLVKGNGMYIEHHRGTSHSVFALMIWTLLISGIILLFAGNIDFLPIFYWTFLGVVLHVVLDLMNAYGTQAGRPFTKKWLSLNFLPLIDPIIYLFHIVGFILWYLGFSPGPTFAFVYIFVGIYIISRFCIYKIIRGIIIDSTEIDGIFTLIPSIWLHKWDFVIETNSTYYVGSVTYKKLQWIHHFDKHDENCPKIKTSLKDKNVGHFLSNSAHTHALIVPGINGDEVRWLDLRFRHKNHYPYMAVAKINNHNEIISSYTGWIHRSKKLENKLAANDKNLVQL